MERSIKRTLAAASILTGLLFVSSTQADDDKGWYLGVGGASIDSNVESETGSDQRFTGANVFLGYKHKAYIGGEVRVGTGLSESESDDFETSLPLYTSFYYRLEGRNDIAKVYFLFGASIVDAESLDLNTGTLFESSESGISWGAGIGFSVSKKVNLNFEFINLINNENNDFDKIGLSLDYRF